jgi:hypothetical protein
MVGPGMANMVADVGESAHELACQCVFCQYPLAIPWHR